MGPPLTNEAQHHPFRFSFQFPIFRAMNASLFLSLTSWKDFENAMLSLNKKEKGNVNSGKKPSDMYTAVNKTYKSERKGWTDFLGASKN
jgi:hypothetical protein